MGLKAFFDASGKQENHPVVTIGGYFAEDTVCEAIQNEWEQATGGKIFHLADFGTKACLLGSANWHPDERIAFLKRLAGIVNREGSTIVSTTVEVEEYLAFVNGTRHAHVFGPAYSGAALVCTAFVEFLLGRSGRKAQKVVYAFEKGDRAHEISKMLTELEKSLTPRGRGERSHFFGGKSVVLLQPADLIAGTIWKTLMNARNVTQTLDNGLDRTILSAYAQYYSEDGVTTSVVSGHEKNCFVVNKPTLSKLDAINEDVFLNKPVLIRNRLKDRLNQGKREKKAASD